MFSAASPPPPSPPGSAALVLVHRPLDRDLERLDAEVGGDSPGVLLCFRAGMGRGHDHAGDPLGAEGVDREQRDERRVDAARERQPDMPEAVLGDVVAQAEDERAVDLGEVGERLGDRAGAGESRSQTSSSSSNCAARAITAPSASRTKLWPSKTSSSWPPTRLQKANCAAVAAGQAAEELLALAALAAVVGGAGGVGDQRRPFGDLGRGGRALDPAVLADGEADPGPGDVDRRRLGAGDEVALLVEDRVVGQAVLAVDGAHGAVGEHGERVVGVAEVAAAGRRLGEADQGDDALDPGRRSPRRRAGWPR